MNRAGDISYQNKAMGGGDGGGEAPGLALAWLAGLGWVSWAGLDRRHQFLRREVEMDRHRYQASRRPRSPRLSS